jgi:ElaB/YqjD/DUF883 family membrane-anchored ribosome-binding protein
LSQAFHELCFDGRGDPTIEELQEQIEALKLALQEAQTVTDEAAAQLADEADALHERLQDNLKEISERIRSNPVQSTLLALGIGFLIGRLLSR